MADTVRITNRANGSVLDNDTTRHKQKVQDHRLQLWTSNNHPNQEWLLEFVGDGTGKFRLVSCENGLSVLADPTRVMDNGARLKFGDPKGKEIPPVYLFELLTLDGKPPGVTDLTGETYVQIRNVATGKVIDADANQLDRAGTDIQMWDSNGNKCQHWSLKKVK